MELARRLVFLILLVQLPNNKVDLFQLTVLPEHISILSLFQAVPVMLVVIYTAVCLYVQPYKSKVTNMMEAAVNANFLLLLILNATSFFHDDYLTFPSSLHSANSTIYM